jgi:hypothetical protein
VGDGRARADHDRDRERFRPRVRMGENGRCVRSSAFPESRLCARSQLVSDLRVHAREPFRLYASACPRPDVDLVLRGGSLAPVGRQ